MNERVIVVGAGPCGLAIARQLRHEQRVDALVVDRASEPAASWRARYDGFRLNTCGLWSHLPGQHIPRRHGRWPRRDDMVAYFDDYARRQSLRLNLGVEVTRIDRDGPGWRVDTMDGPVTADAVVVATGNYHTPALPAWPGAETLRGKLIHSVDYRNPWPFRGEDVVVVGSGNSATDIALQLCDGVAARVRMAIRTPPHLVPRSTAGIPVDAFSPPLSAMPVPVVDTLAAVMRRLIFGDLTTHGVPAPGDGMYTALLQDRRIPTLGDELVTAIKAGKIEVTSAVTGFEDDKILLADGTRVTADSVIAATGYETGLEAMVGHLGVLDDEHRPLRNGLPAAAPGLWFAGYDEPIIGPLRSFRRQAGPIAAAVARHIATEQ